MVIEPKGEMRNLLPRETLPDLRELESHKATISPCQIRPNEQTNRMSEGQSDGSPPSQLEQSPLDLKGLLASLASFAKAAQGLPVGEDFSFESSFPDFQKALKSAQVRNQKKACVFPHYVLLGSLTRSDWRYC